MTPLAKFVISWNGYADANGVMNFSTYLPLGATGRTLYCHRVELDGAGGGALSNPVEIEVQ
ncbi:MAG: hypothetical protein QM477_06990 [Planctomycetota bacterium]